MRVRTAKLAAFPCIASGRITSDVLRILSRTVHYAPFPVFLRFTP